MERKARFIRDLGKSFSGTLAKLYEVDPILSEDDNQNCLIVALGIEAPNYKNLGVYPADRNVKWVEEVPILTELPKGHYSHDEVLELLGYIVFPSDPADKIDAAYRKWRETSAGKESMKKWAQSEAGKRSLADYAGSEKGRASFMKYYNSPKGQAAFARSYDKVKNLRKIEKWLKDNPGKTPADYFATQDNTSAEPSDERPVIKKFEPKRILVCGDRNWKYLDVIERILSEYPSADVVIEGEASGADTMGKIAAFRLGLSVEAYPADWKTKGLSAGYQRNRRMLNEGNPDLVLAFHSAILYSKGTKNMLKIAYNADVPCRLFDHEGMVVPLPESIVGGFTNE